MITLRRNEERQHVRRGKHDTWLTFFPREGPNPGADDFGILATFDEIRHPPGGVSTNHTRAESEIVTYIYKGALAQEDSTGSSGVVHAGEFQHMTMGLGIRRKETNASRSDWTHLFRISLHPSEAGLDYAHEQKRFAAAQRHNVLCVTASPDGRKKSLPILQDAIVYSSILDSGHHIIHELMPGRSAWLHVICGEMTLDDSILTRGDGAGFMSEPSVSLTAQERTEILLVDLGPAPKPFAGGIVP